ncbi:hypothetical protein N9J42_01055 [bacterium]|nr:hypothetical protein [bacterium]
MIKIKDIIGLPSLQYHVDNNLSLHENVYRYSSKSFIQLFAEARDAWRDGIIELEVEDANLIETTDIGLYGDYNGQRVPLDLPMISEQMDLEDELANEEFGMDYDQLGSGEKEWVRDEIDNMSMNETNKISDDKLIRLIPKLPKGYVGKNAGTGKYTISTPDGDDIVLTSSKDKKNWFYEPSNVALKILNEDRKYNQEELLRLDLIARRRFDCDYEKCTDDQKAAVLKDKAKVGVKEAKYKGKDVPLNKPKRGGSKKFFVYTKNKKGNVVKVSFGGTTGLTVKIKEKGARASFAARHKCATKKDKTKPGYWACNVGRYWKSLGGAKNFSGYW